jgi:hypothetical protein
MDVPRSLDVRVGVGVAIWEARRERVMALSYYFVGRRCILGLPVPQGGPGGEVKRPDGYVSILA